MEELYTTARYFVPYDRPLPERALRGLFELLCHEIDPDSSPGFPYIWEGVTSNAQVCEKPSLKEQAYQRFRELMMLIFEGKKLPLCTVRLFVKPEPHKIEKIEEDRLRLIWSLPLEYQLVHRHFFGPSLAAELANYRTIPTKVGMSWSRGGAHDIYMTLYDAGRDEIADVDKRGWDLSCPHWLIRLDAASRWRLCLNPNKLWKHAIEQCYDTLLLSRVIFSDGTILEQTIPGIVRSGSMITISGNSRMQVILKVLFCIEHVGYFDWRKHMIIAIGDDSLERLYDILPQDYVDWLRRYGFSCKEISMGPLAGRTFCSHGFKKFGNRYVPVALNWEKHLYLLCYKEKAKLANFADQLYSLCYEHCFDDEKFGQLRLAQIGLGVIDQCKSQESLQAFFTGFESALSEHSLLHQKLLRAELRDVPAPRLVCVEENPGPVTFATWEFCFAVVCLTAGVWLILSRTLSDEQVGRGIRILVTMLLLSETARVSAQVGLRSSFITDPKHKDSTAQKWFDEIVTKPLLPAFEKTVHFIGRNLYPSQADKFLTREEQRERKQLHDYERQRELAYKHQLSQQSTVVSEMPKKKNGTAKSVTVTTTTVKSAKHKNMQRRSKGAQYISSVPGSKRNGMDYSCVKGSDYIQALHVTGPDTAGQQIKEGAGACIYKLQLQPFNMIPNSRLKKFGDLFEKWRFKHLEFEIRSTMASTNAGSVLLVYEPNALEALPDIGTAADAKALSKYEAHSNVQICSFSQKTDRESKKYQPCRFNVNTSLMKGPFGGWFFNDPTDSEPLNNISQGQFMIMVQDPLNCLGSAATGAYTAGQDIVWGSLICHYEIELSVANDEVDSFLEDPPTSAGMVLSTIGTFYANPLKLALDGESYPFDEVGFVSPSVQMTNAPFDEIGFQFYLTDGLGTGASAEFNITTLAGNPINDFGVFINLCMRGFALADAGTSNGSYWTNPQVNGAGMVRQSRQSSALAGTLVNNCDAFCHPASALSLNTGGWTVGGTGSTSATAQFAVEFYAFTLPWRIYHNTSAMQGIRTMCQTRPDLARKMPKYLLQMRKKEPEMKDTRYLMLQQQLDELKRALHESKEEKKERVTTLSLDVESTPATPMSLDKPRVVAPSGWVLAGRKTASTKA